MHRRVQHEQGACSRGIESPEEWQPALAERVHCFDLISLHDFQRTWHTGSDFRPDRVARVEVRSRGLGDEPLRAFGVFSAACHACNSLVIVFERSEFAADGITRSAPTRCSGVAGLNNEIRDDTMEYLIA